MGAYSADEACCLYEAQGRARLAGVHIQIDGSITMVLRCTADS